MLARRWWMSVLLIGVLFGSIPAIAGDLSSADYTIVAGDFNGDGYTDLL